MFRENGSAGPLTPSDLLHQARCPLPRPSSGLPAIIDVREEVFDCLAGVVQIAIAAAVDLFLPPPVFNFEDVRNLSVASPLPVYTEQIT